MNAMRKVCLGMSCSFIVMAMSVAQATTVTYLLDNAVLINTYQMTGIFDWTYTEGDFENGEGQWTSLYIPWTSHGIDDLETTFDIGSSIEITFPGNVHDDGLDITLFLLQPLTPTTSSSIDLVRSKYEIGGNGFHSGFFDSGRVISSTVLDGDLNGDGLIDAADVGIMFGNWGPSDAIYSNGNLNGDGFIDAADTGIMFSNWGTSSFSHTESDLPAWEADHGTGALFSASSAVVPEPSAILLGIMATLIGISCRRHS